MIPPINNEIFADYLRCQYKAYLKLQGRTGQKTEYEELQNRLLQQYRIRACQLLLSSKYNKGGFLTEIALSKLRKHPFKIATNVIATVSPYSVLFDAVTLTSSSEFRHYVPITFVHKENVSKNDKLYLAFCGSVLGMILDCRLPFGRILHGENYRSMKVKLEKLIPAATEIMQRIVALKDSDTPPLHINRHCQICEFAADCRLTALENDYLSLLPGLTPKDVARLNNKGIFTITQYSYTFRPRRKRKQPKNYRIRHRPELKAIAIRENKIYVYGTPQLPQATVEIYLDVEGIPDRHFYYLVGLLVVDRGQHVEYSFWANRPSEQKDIFCSFLKTVSKYKDYTIYHYGRYELDYMKRMAKTLNNDIAKTTMKIKDRCCNLLSYFHSEIYVPSYSNSLKEIASFLGFSWTEPNPSGIKSIVWRQDWEINRSIELKSKLQQYNMEDCQALVKVKELVEKLKINENAKVAGSNFPDAIFCEDIKSSSAFLFLTRDYALPEIQAIHKCSHFDYQRQKVFVRTDKVVRALEAKRQKKRKSVLRPNKKRDISARVCVNCKSKGLLPVKPTSKRIVDLRFFDSGVKRWITQINSHIYRCKNCEAHFVPKRFRTGGNYVPEGYRKARSKYGHSLKSWVIFQHIFNKHSFRQIESNLYELFKLAVNKSTLHEFKLYIYRYYAHTYKLLIREILNSAVLYADETPLKMKNEDAYAWVFTNNKEVVSFYRPTREADFLKEFLKDYHGILVSDFYTAYDSIDCIHQKCLIHLLRDLNDDLLKNPFDEEFKTITHRFTIVLQSIVGTIDKYGLKKRHLYKHKKEVTSFFNLLTRSMFRSEIAGRYRDRFLKNRNRLFEFLNHDNVSWNNNNAEQAIKLLATHTNKNMKSFTAARMEEYLRIMSIYQTCVYNNISFLRFLLSRERDLGKYLEANLR